MIEKFYKAERSFLRTPLLLAASLLVGSSLIAQSTGPGGVGTSLNMASWLDANQIVGAGNGDPIGTWSDASTNGNDAVQGAGANQPAYVASGIGGRPSLNFVGSDFMEIGATSDLDSDEVTWFIVSQATVGFATGERRGLIETETSFSNATWGTFMREFNNILSGMYSIARESGGSVVFSNTDFSTTAQLNPFITTAVVRADDSFDNFLNGNGGVNGAGADANGFTHVQTIIGSRYSKPTEFFDGQISEVILFNEELNSAEITIISNYLGAKYGVGLGTLAIYDNGGTHSFDVAGIGRDDAANEHLSAQGTGIVAVTAASLDDADYLFWGHDNGGLTTSITNTPASYAATNGTRIDQEWIVTEAGETGTIDLSFDLTGIEFGQDDEYELLVNEDGDGDFSDAQTYSGTVLGSVITFTLDGSELEDGYRFTIGNTQETIISIADGQNWNQTSTWSCSCIPADPNSVIIDAGHTVTVTDAQNVLSLDVDGTLVIDNGAEFEVRGDVDSDGAFTINSDSKITLNGSALQTLDFVGTVAFDTLEVDNANDVVLNTGTFTFDGVLYVTDGDIDFNGNGVTFISDATNTGSIGPVGAGGSISGLTAVTSQRFVPAGVAGMREVGFPFASSFRLSDWDDEIFISGPGFPDQCAAGGNGCYTSAKYWDPLLTTMRGVTDIDSVINAGRGIDIFLGDNLNTFSATTLSTSKSLNLATSVDLTLQDGWNFIANPFLSPISFNRVTLDGNTENYFWVYDPENDWQWWDGDLQMASTAELDSGIITTYQGFWVFQTAGGPATMTIDQSSKAPTAANSFIRSHEFGNSSLGFMVHLRETTSGRKSDLTVLVGQEKNEGHEIPKMPDNSKGINLHTESTKGDKVKIANFQGHDCIEFPIYVEHLIDHSLQLSFSNIPIGYQAYLNDKARKELIPLGEGETVDVSVLDETEVNDRFEVKLVKADICSEPTIGQTLLASYTELSLNLFNENGFETSDVTVYNLQGQVVFNTSIQSSNMYQIAIPCELSSGAYIVSSRSLDGRQLTAKFIVNR